MEVKMRIISKVKYLLCINKFVSLIFILLATYGLYKIGNSDIFQKMFFPESYWRKQVSALEWKIKHAEYQVRNGQREIQKIRLTSQIEILDKVDFAETLGSNSTDARADAVKELEENITSIQSMTDSWNESIPNDRSRLNEARSELARRSK